MPHPIRKVEVLPYQRRWRAEYRDEALRIAALFGARVSSVHHIGSTSVPGLPAKPIIDILVQVDDIQAVAAFDPQLRALDYLPKGEYGIPGRRLYIKGDEYHRTHHVHVYQRGNPEIDRHLHLRDYLAAHPQQARRYGELKLALARRYPEDMEAYIAGKDALVKELETQALDWIASRMG